jgi:hypothetical protein
MSLVKFIPLSKIGPLNESANLELRANFFNIFNQLNLAPFAFGSFVSDYYGCKFWQGNGRSGGPGRGIPGEDQILKNEELLRSGRPPV